MTKFSFALYSSRLFNIPNSQTQHELRETTGELAVQNPVKGEVHLLATTSFPQLSTFPSKGTAGGASL